MARQQQREMKKQQLRETVSKMKTKRKKISEEDPQNLKALPRNQTNKSGLMNMYFLAANDNAKVR